MFEEYPRWTAVSGPGHPDNPGYVLVGNADEEAKAKETGTGPAGLNPPPNPDQKSLDTMERPELIATLVKEGIPDDMTDDEIRSAIQHGRDKRDEDAKEAADAARADYEARLAGGDHGDGMQTTKVPSGDPEASKDAAGDAIAPDPAKLANNAADAPKAKATSATDATPDEGTGIPAADAPAGNVSDQAALSPDDKKAGK